MKSQAVFARIDERTELLAEHLIGNLDEDGYLRRDLDAIVNDLAFTQNVNATKEELEKALKELQSLGPGRSRCARPAGMFVDPSEAHAAQFGSADRRSHPGQALRSLQQEALRPDPRSVGDR
jgi:hypothetical protein